MDLGQRECKIENKSEILTVVCGIREDWAWTAETVFENGKYSDSYDWNKENLCVAGIHGSAWGTPVMEVVYKGGRIEMVDCYVGDGKEGDRDTIEFMKAFAAATGGMDYKF